MRIPFCCFLPAHYDLRAELFLAIEGDSLAAPWLGVFPSTCPYPEESLPALIVVKRPGDWGRVNFKIVRKIWATIDSFKGVNDLEIIQQMGFRIYLHQLEFYYCGRTPFWVKELYWFLLSLNLPIFSLCYAPGVIAQWRVDLELSSFEALVEEENPLQRARLRYHLSSKALRRSILWAYGEGPGNILFVYRYENEKSLYAGVQGCVSWSLDELLATASKNHLQFFEQIFMAPSIRIEGDILLWCQALARSRYGRAKVTGFFAASRGARVLSFLRDQLIQWQIGC